MFPSILFFIFAGVLVCAALGVILSRNPVYSALLLVLCFFNSAVIWVLLDAEFLGIVLVLVYVAVLPVVLSKKVFKSYYDKLGVPRYYVTVFLFLMMMELPIKMLLRWIFNLKYIVGIPEIFFNI